MTSRRIGRGVDGDGDVGGVAEETRARRSTVGDGRAVGRARDPGGRRARGRERTHASGPGRASVCGRAPAVGARETTRRRRGVTRGNTQTVTAA